MTKWAEYKALLADMAARRYILEDLEIWKHRPTIYVDACAEGIAGLYLLRDIVPDPDLNPRLRMIPEVVRHARRNLTSPSRLDCRAASERLLDLIGFLEYLRTQPLPNKAPELIGEAVAALGEFAVFVDSLAFTADPEYALGYDEFMLLLDTRNMISDTPEAMRTYAEGVFRTVNAELDAFGDLPAPQAGEITPESLTAQVDSIWGFIGHRDLVTLPQYAWGSGPGMRVIEMPDYARPVFGDVLYIEPWPGAEPSYLTPLYVWSGISGPGITADGLAASEILPGRHLQALSAAMRTPPIIRMHHDIFAINGWTLYCQDLLAAEGYGGAEAVRAALERRRFYAAGTVAAVNLLLGEFTLEQAADFLVKETGISETYARELAVQYALEPELPISYIIGEREISRMRNEVSRLRGDGFSLKTFHDDVLACGRLPLYLIRNNLVTGSVGRR
jgi:hypothetical protein